MRKLVLGVSLFLCFSAYSQKAITNEVRGDLRFSIGITASKVYTDTPSLKWINIPALALTYNPSITEKLELQLGVTIDGKGGRSDTPFAKYRSYNAGALLGVRYRAKDFTFGGGLNPVYFIDTKKSVPEGGLISGSLHYSVPHFRNSDVPVYVSAELKMNDKVNLELRYAASVDRLVESNLPQIHSVTLSAAFLIAHRYKRERVSIK